MNFLYHSHLHSFVFLSLHAFYAVTSFFLIQQNRANKVNKSTLNKHFRDSQAALLSLLTSFGEAGKAYKLPAAVHQKSLIGDLD